MISSGINLVMTVIGFAVSTMFIVFVCTRLICARIQLNSSRRAFRIASGPDLNIHSTCPVCRISLRDLTEKKRLMQPMFSSAIRSQYSTESPGTNYYHCLLSGQRASTGALNCSMDSIQGDQFLPDGSGEPGESNSILCDDHQITKDSRNKRVECPSNP